MTHQYHYHHQGRYMNQIRVLRTLMNCELLTLSKVVVKLLVK
jgi:hypothetical protein